MGKHHLPAIDGLRALAVLAVVAYHAGLPLAAGYVGVDVFFVISGYVITRLLLAEPIIDLAAFYARRVRRILPALLVVVATTLAASAALLSADLQIETNQSAVAAMAMAANFWFQFATGGYFDASAGEMPLLHLWSLAVEEQFYLLWPVLLVACRRRPWLLAVLAVASLALSQHWVGVDREFAFYQMPSRFWELAAGGLLAMAPALRKDYAALAAMLGAVALYVALTLSAPVFPGLGAVPAVVGTTLVLLAVHSGIRIAPLEWGPVRYIGLVSYSFYLWHWPLLAIARGTRYDEPALATKLALCGAAFLLGALSYHFVETPFRRANPPKVRAIAIGAAACLALAGCSGAMVSLVRGGDTLSARTAADAPRESPDCQGVDVACAADVVLWGDSHAKMWQPFAERYGRVHQLTAPGCVASSLADQGKACDAFNAKALPIAQQARVVILGGFWLERMTLPIDRHNARQDFRSALAALQGRRVIVIGPVPELPAIPQRCIRSGEFDRCTRSRAVFEHRAQPVRAWMLAEVARHPNVEWIDPTPFFCNATACPMLRDGDSLYWDDDHISARAARGFAGYLGQEKGT